MLNTSNLDKFLEEIRRISDLELLLRPAEQKRFSRDFFDYSPILREKLAECCADVVVKPLSVDAVLSVAFTCQKHEVPLTIRGAGTVN